MLRRIGAKQRTQCGIMRPIRDEVMESLLPFALWFVKPEIKINREFLFLDSAFRICRIYRLYAPVLNIGVPRHHRYQIPVIALLIGVHEDENVGIFAIGVDCRELLVCFVNVPHEPIEDRVMAQAADQFSRPGSFQFVIEPVIVLYMLGFAKGDELAQSENAEVRRLSLADLRSGEPLGLETVPLPIGFRELFPPIDHSYSLMR